ncbi:hypothetical protein [Pseudanabaena sp. FACHB-2040]|uniref:hypothetical protein n=1 Tax=Pseudanabaena sp. FACHB-2040 TaxID=2692859 RepID=UPI001687F4E2|nr:hypothetical protein [Pseudanabaena sp. FACHB-2040]MBD2256978.1 hypothetical protein [Pseudanabaena sp. FACHB-2040]
MTGSFFGKTSTGKFRAALCKAVATLAAGAGFAILAAPAQAGTVIIGTHNFTISTPNFFLSVGNPVVVYPQTGVYYPGVVYHPGVVHYPVVHRPAVRFPTTQIYPYRTYQRVYRVERRRPTLVIDDAVSAPIEGDSLSVYPAYPTALPDTSRYTLVTPYLEADTSADPITRFTSNSLPWLEVNLSTPQQPDALPVIESPAEPQSGTTTYRLSSPSPFNQSLGTLGE